MIDIIYLLLNFIPQSPGSGVVAGDCPSEVFVGAEVVVDVVVVSPVNSPGQYPLH